MVGQLPAHDLGALPSAATRGLGEPMREAPNDTPLPTTLDGRADAGRLQGAGRERSVTRLCLC